MMRWSTLQAAQATAGILFAALLTCCGDGSDTQSDRKVEDERLRIISLSPAISRTLVDFGLTDRIVGRTPFCESVPQEIPVVGSLMDANYEAMVRLDPTHVLVQPPSTGLDPELRRLAAEHGWVLGEWSAVNTIDDIEAMVRELPGVLHKQPSPEFEAATIRAAELVNQIAAALRPEPSAWRGSVLIIYSTEPVGAFGRETYLHDVLVRCGAMNVVPASGWVTLSLEDVSVLDPQAIILVKPGAGADDDAEFGPLATLDVQATRDGRLAVMRSADAMLPSTGIIEAADELRRVLHNFAGNER